LWRLSEYSCRVVVIDGVTAASTSGVLDVLLLEMSDAIIRSRKCLSTRSKIASEGGSEVDGVEVSPEIFVQTKALSIGAAVDAAHESTIVFSTVFPIGVISDDSF
jgi:hypothetical protein